MQCSLGVSTGAPVRDLTGSQLSLAPVGSCIRAVSCIPSFPRGFVASRKEASTSKDSGACPVPCGLKMHKDTVGDQGPGIP